jgi:hypothetical protein
MSRNSHRVFHESDFLHGDGMLTKIWGPSLWHTLHVMSFNYPVQPTSKQKKDYRNFILNLANVLPCKHCRNNLHDTFEKLLPLTLKDMANRESFSKYIYLLHEHVNKMLKKNSGLSFHDVRERYEHFRSRCSKQTSCSEPLVGKKAKCVLRIIPDSVKTKTLKINKNCLKSRKLYTPRKLQLHPKIRKVI